MPLQIAGQVGPSAQWAADAANVEFRQGKTGDLIVTQLAGRFSEMCYRNQLFSTGHTALTALSANTITLTATTTPILGVWNPITSGMNVHILKVALQIAMNTSATPVSPGALVWAVSNGNGVISTGLTPWNRRALAQVGSVAKGFAGSTALTGLTNNLVIMDAAAEFTPQFVLSGTAPTVTTSFSHGTQAIQYFDGAIIVPPGGVLALLNTVSTTTWSAAGRLVWAELPV